MNKYDAYEITPMQFIDADCEDAEPIFDDTPPDYWTLFGHLKGEGVEEIADYPTKDAAVIGLMTSALVHAKIVLEFPGEETPDWVLIREALRFAKEKL